MKTTNTLFRFLIWIISAVGVTACNDHEETPEISGTPRQGVPLSVNVARLANNEPTLQYGVYIFSRPVGEGEYGLDSIILPVNEDSRIKFDNSLLVRREYRFLFIATPSDNSALKVVNASLTQPLTGTLWSNIRIVPQADSISIDNYYEVTDRSGEDILSTDTIQGHLTRIVGQPVFRFFKIGTSLNDLIPIDLTTVTSIFDRIQSIQIDYQNYTPAIAFDANGIPQPEAPQSAGQSTITQKITTTLEHFRLPLPQQNLVLIQSDAANGGEIKGYCFLPNTPRLRTSLTFTYYDTTPACGDAEHAHDETCYPLRTLTLNIPKQSAPGLSVEADTYTVSKAGIRCDRLIDIEYVNNMDIITDWYK